MTNRSSRWWQRVGDQVTRTEAATDRVLESSVLPAWQRVTSGEPRWPVTAAIVLALVLQFTLAPQVQLRHRWILPMIAALLLLITVVINPRRITRVSTSLRATSMILIASITTANVVSAFRLVNHLLNGTWHSTARTLLFTGGAIWFTNVIAFALWYWELDRGGPVSRMNASRQHVDFLFPQMQSPELSRPDWESGFVDYMYLSFTNASAFSPTDVLPLTRWAKLTMMTQSMISLATVALVIARAVNIL